MVPMDYNISPLSVEPNQRWSSWYFLLSFHYRQAALWINCCSSEL